MNTPAVSTVHSRGQRNKHARLANGIVSLLFFLIFLCCIIGFFVFLTKQLQVNNLTIYNNDTYGDCLLYADYVEDGLPNIHLGRSGLCGFVIFGELCVTVLVLIVFFVLAFKVVVGCALLRLDLVVELIVSAAIGIFQFIVGLSFTSGVAKTCDAFTASGTRCHFAVLPIVTPNNVTDSINVRGMEFFGDLLIFSVCLWLTMVLFIIIVVYYMIMVSFCCYKRIQSRKERGNILVEEDVYSVEAESEFRETGTL